MTASLTMVKRGAGAHRVTIWPDGVVRRDAESSPWFGAWQVRAPPHAFAHIEPLVARLSAGGPQDGDLEIVLADAAGARSTLDDSSQEGTSFWLAATFIEGVVARTPLAPMDTTGAKDLNPWADGVPLTLIHRSFIAHGLGSTKGLVVLAGSIVSTSTTRSLEDYYKSARASFLEDGALQLSEGDCYVLQRHLVFDSPSAAASVVVGSNTNGRKSWRDSQGRPWSEIFP